MRLGAEDRKKATIAAVLGVVALVSVFYMSGRGSEPSPAALQVASEKNNKKTAVISDLDPSLRFDLLRQSESREYQGGKRNIFLAGGSAPVAPAPKPNCPGFGCPPPQPPAQVCPGAPGCPPPPPPPINLKFFGFASQPGEAKQVFLSSGDDVFIAKEGDIVNRRYRIVKIKSNGVEVEDVLNNNTQTLPLTSG